MPRACQSHRRKVHPAFSADQYCMRLRTLCLAPAAPAYWRESPRFSTGRSIRASRMLDACVTQTLSPWSCIAGLYVLALFPFRNRGLDCDRTRARCSSYRTLLSWLLWCALFIPPRIRAIDGPGSSARTRRNGLSRHKARPSLPKRTRMPSASLPKRVCALSSFISHASGFGSVPFALIPRSRGASRFSADGSLPVARIPRAISSSTTSQRSYI